MLTQQHPLPPLTSTVKSPLFTHLHSSSLSLAARLHQCHANCSHYINNGLIFFQTDLIYHITLLTGNETYVNYIIAKVNHRNALAAVTKFFYLSKVTERDHRDTVIHLLIFQIMKLVPKEVMQITQGDTVNPCQQWDKS